MACVGTLSWSVAGLAGWTEPARRVARPVETVSGRPAGPRQPQARKAMDPGDRTKVGGNPQAMDGRTMGSREAARSAGMNPTMHGETTPLEIDWAHTVRRCMDGDSAAWAELVRSHHRRVYGLCYRFTGSAADAEDLTQDVFLKVYSNLASFDTARGSLQVWITTMTRNLLVDNFRRTKNQRATGSLDEGWDQTEEMKPVDRLTASGPTPHEMAARKEIEKMVQQALAHVSAELREAVILRDLQDMDYKEIAQVLGIPEGTVKSRISRGRAELARLLDRNKREVM